MLELPTGTVTFLFSDVEGSTELLRRLRDGYADVMADHEQLLRAAFQECGGHEINTQGDSFFVAFRKPKAAVSAAVRAQRSLARHPWPDDAELRVRIGIHTGEATVAGDRYVGLAVHRAARICAVAHGGQVLLSQTTQALLEEEEELGELDFNDLGPRSLKNFDRPVRIYQLLAPELPDDFPELRSTDEGAPGSAELADRLEVADVEEAAREEREKSVKVLIVDDQALVRTGFRMILDAEEDMDVVGEAADGKEAIAEAGRLNPDVVLMDVRMPELDGIEATRRLLADGGVDSKVVMLTTFDMDEYVYEALRAGASGFLLKDAPPEQLVDGIRAVCSGDALLAPSVTRRVIEEFVRRPPPEAARTAPPEIEELTPRESEVLKLIARGFSNAEIAKDLVVSETTVKTHVAHVLMKMGLRDRVQAVVMAYESGLVQPGEAGSAPAAV
jgi:DNA-binding NarL/FixJ family response regulator/class 3 adenylate cyclase